ncbi:hypothetical protein DPMN_049936 [Dreissena polymorpha]|uniref:Uncharacterized protein n=1 Tax=Dreissena polymorpha TaxID=45954 RepID=A0A9D4CG93_DREPO|nr:hypothetical protein DPMN_049936 [Dreissena polymorpha]
MTSDCAHSFGHFFSSQIFWHSAVNAAVVGSPPCLISSVGTCPLPKVFLPLDLALPHPPVPQVWAYFRRSGLGSF